MSSCTRMMQMRSRYVRNESEQRTASTRNRYRVTREAMMLCDWALAPGHRHGEQLAEAIAANIRGPVSKPVHKTHQLLHRLLVSPAAFLRTGQFSSAEYAGFRVTAGPRNLC